MSTITVAKALETISQQFEQADIFFGHGIDNAWDEAVFLVLSVCDLPLESDETVLQENIREPHWLEIQQIATERVQSKKPLAYLLKQAWFRGLCFYVDERVLIPRSPIGEVVVNAFSPWLTHQPRQILDMCTGSGCLAILAAKIFPEARIDAVDISKDALAVAEKNVALHQVEEQVSLIESDLFSALIGKKYDVIMANPPYVGAAEMSQVPEEYLHEPNLALEAKDNGMHLVKQIFAQYQQFLQPNGILIMDVGNTDLEVDKQYPHLPITWLEMADGGHGILLLCHQDVG